MRSGAHLIQGREVEDPPQVGDAAGVYDGGADVVDELLGDQLLHVPDRAQVLADGDRGGGVLPDVPERFLVLGGGRVLHPEQPVGLHPLAELGGLVGGEPVVHVVQQVEAEAETVPDGLEVGGREIQVGLCGPGLLVGQRGGGRFVDLALADTVGPPMFGTAAWARTAL